MMGRQSMDDHARHALTHTSLTHTHGHCFAEFADKAAGQILRATAVYPDTQSQCVWAMLASNNARARIAREASKVAE